MKDHFSKIDIDAINDDAGDNYFHPVLKHAFQYIGEVYNICDIGCGNGVFSGNIKNWHSCNLVGVDGSSYALEKAANFNYDKLVKVEDFSKDNLPFEDQSFDLVINKDVLEHLIDPENLVNEISRIIIDGGHAIIHVPNHFPIIGRIKLLFTNNIDPFNYFPDSKRWNFPHIRFFNKKELIELLELSNLYMVQDLSYHFGRIPILWRLIPSKIRNIIYNKFSDSLCEGFTILAKKSIN